MLSSTCVVNAFCKIRYGETTQDYKTRGKYRRGREPNTSVTWPSAIMLFMSVNAKEQWQTCRSSSRTEKVEKLRFVTTPENRSLQTHITIQRWTKIINCSYLPSTKMIYIVLLLSFTQKYTYTRTCGSSHTHVYASTLLTEKHAHIHTEPNGINTYSQTHEQRRKKFLGTERIA